MHSILLGVLLGRQAGMLFKHLEKIRQTVKTQKVADVLQAHVEAPAELTYTDGANLSWEASADAVSYRVYRAVNDQATYELIAENVIGTTFTYDPSDLQKDDQLILRVTAVNADGVESEGIRVITWIE